NLYPSAWPLSDRSHGQSRQGTAERRADCRDLAEGPQRTRVSCQGFCDFAVKGAVAPCRSDSTGRAVLSSMGCGDDRFPRTLNRARFRHVTPSQRNPHESPCPGDIAVSSPAQAQSSRVVDLGTGSTPGGPAYELRAHAVETLSRLLVV